jgi:biopolymer transport protein ExbD
MTEQTRNFDVWFVQANQVYKEVPFTVVTDWLQQVRLGADDMLKPSGTPNWFKVSSQPLFQPYLPQAMPAQPAAALVKLEPIELEFNWKRRYEDEDDDVDMIPLIDISLVLLIFFMMTTTVAAISRILVPNMENAVKIDTSPKVLRIDIDMVDGKPLYSLARGIEAPQDVDANLSNDTTLMLRLDAALQTISEADRPEVRIAAHGDLPYEIVERVMKQLDTRRAQRLINEYNIEVNERPPR